MIKDKIAIGINTSTLDNKHILFFDFDINKIFYQAIKNELELVMNKYELSDIHIIETQNGFNSICLNKLTIIIVYELLKDTNTIDKSFVLIGLEKHCYTLRMSPNKQYLSCVKSIHNKNEKSYGHFIFFTDIMGYPISNNENMDNNTYVELCFFTSCKSGFICGKSKDNNFRRRL